MSDDPQKNVVEAKRKGRPPRAEVAIAPTAAVVAQTPPPTDLMGLIAAVINNPDADVSKLEALLRVQTTVRAEDSRREYIVAMAEAQAEIEPVARLANNPQTKSKYAKLEHVDAAIRPIYTRHGFALSFNEEPGSGGNMRIVCTVAHRGGHEKQYGLDGAPDILGPKGTPTKTDLHGRGSTITFLRRYLTCNIFNIVLRDIDDDGNRGGGNVFVDEQMIALMEKLSKGFSEAEMEGFWDYIGAEIFADIPHKDAAKAINALHVVNQRHAKATPETGK